MFKDLISLSFETTTDLVQNLQTLLALVESAPEDSFIVAPEVSLSGFDYEHLDSVVAFASRATSAIRAITKEKTLVVTMLEKRGEHIYNTMKLFHRGEVIYERAKARLFALGDEEKYMLPGEDEDIVIVEIDGVKVGILVCFELRFKQFWSVLEGADIIAVSAWWGALRAKHLVQLTEALALINQCYVVVSDSANKECSGLSGVISAFGISHRNGNNPCLKVPYEQQEIKRMRRYIDVGIK
jgi:omega-amidase